MVLPHARREKHNMDLLRKLKFWRKRKVEDDVLKYIKELESTLQENEATIATQEERMKEQNIKSEQVEATLRSRLSELEEVEATLRGQIKEVEKKGTDAETTAEAEKLQGTGADVEADLHRQIEELGSQPIDKEKLEANRHENIKEPQKELQECDADKENLEIVLNGKIKELQNKLKETERYTASLEFQLRFRIRELEEELQETDVLKKEAESAFRREREYYVRRQRERNAITDQVETAISDTINQLSNQLAKSVRESRQIYNEKERAITRIQTLENNIRYYGKDHKRVNMFRDRILAKDYGKIKTLENDCQYLNKKVKDYSLEILDLEFCLKNADELVKIADKYKSTVAGPCNEATMYYRTKLQEVDNDWMKVVACLNGQINELNKKLETSNKAKKVEFDLRDEIKALERVMLETQKHAIEKERALRVHLIHCKRKSETTSSTTRKKWYLPFR
jgi:hypothetical protein